MEECTAIFFSRTKIISPKTRPSALTASPPMSSVRPPMPPRKVRLIEIGQFEVSFASRLFLSHQRRG